MNSRPLPSQSLHSAVSTRFRRTRRLAILSASIAVLGFAGAANAEKIWNAGGGLDFNWDTAGNWSPNGAPLSTDDLLFPSPIPNPGSLALPSTILLNTGETANSLSFNDAYTLSGGSLSLTSGSVAVSAGIEAVISSILGGGALNKTGAGTLTLSNVNTYAGGATISGGVLRITGAVGALQGATTINSGGTLHMNVVSAADITFANAISGAGTLKITAPGSGTVTNVLTGNLSGFTGTMEIFPSDVGGGKARLTSPSQAAVPASSATINLQSGGTLFINTGFTYGNTFQLFGGTTAEAIGQLRVESNANVAGSVVLKANSTIGSNSGTGTISGVIGESGGSFGFTKQGPGTIVISNGANSYTGVTGIAAGTLSLTGGANRLPAGTTVSFTGNGTLNLNNNAQSVAGVSVGAGVTGTLAGGTLTLGGGTIAFLGNTGTSTLTGGTLAISGAVVDSTAVGNANGVVRTLATPITGSGGLTLNVHGDTSDTGGSSTSLFSLTGANTFTGGVTIGSGLVNVSSAFGDAANVITINGGGLVSTASFALPASRAITLGGVGDRIFRAYTGQTLTINGGINGTGSLRKTDSGTLLLTGANSYSGATIVGAGTLQAGVGGTNGSLGSGDITINPGATLILNRADSFSLGQAINGGGSFVKAGGGTVTLNGANPNPFTGLTSVNNGALNLDFANLATPADLMNSASSLAFGGGRMTIKAKAGAAATSQSFAGVTINNGGGQLLVDPNGGAGATLHLGALTATASGGSLLIGTPAGAGAGTATVTASGGKDAAGVYGGRIVLANGAANAGYDWATTNSAAAPFTLSGYSGYQALDVTAGADSVNSRITAGAALGGARTTNSLKIEDPAAGQTLAIGPNSLTLANGGLLLTGSNAISITGDAGATRLTAGNGSGSYDLVVHQFNSGGATISAVIGNNDVNPVRLVKAGTGTLNLTGANTYTAGTSVNAGVLNVTTTANTLGSAVNVAPGATLSVNTGSNAVTFNNTFTGTGTVNVSTSNLNGFVLSGNWSGFAGTINVNTTGGGKLAAGTSAFNSAAVVNISNGASFFSGGGSFTNAFTVTGTGNNENRGAIRLESNATISGPITLLGNATVGSGATGFLSGAISGNFGITTAPTGGGTIVLSGPNTYTGATNLTTGTLRLGNSSTVQFSTVNKTGGTLAFDTAVASHAFTLGGLSGNSAIALQDTAATPNPIALSAGNNGENTVYSGVLSGAGSLTKIGAGVLTLSGLNTYTGATNVNAGALLVSGALAGSTDVNSGASFGGTGNVLAVNLHRGGTLTPGGISGDVGALNTGALSFEDGSAFSLQLDASGIDQAQATGPVTLAGAITLSLALEADPVDGLTYTILNSTGGIGGYAGGARFVYAGNSLDEGELFTVATGSLSQVFTIQYAANGGSSVTLQAIPEPGSVACLLAGAAMLGLRRVRRRRAPGWEE